MHRFRSIWVIYVMKACTIGGRNVCVYVYPMYIYMIYVGNTSLDSCDSFKVIGVTFNSKYIFARHIHSFSSLVAQKVGLLRKSFRIFGGSECHIEIFHFYSSLHGVLLPCLVLCSRFPSLS